MNKQLLHMQKLAGLITESEYKQLVSEGSLKDKIKELVHSSLGEAKKKKSEPEDVAPQEEAPAEDTLEPTDADMGMDTEAPSVDTGIDIDPKVKNIQDLLQKAYANAKALGDEKLMTQIGNTITMVVRNQVLGGQAVAESLEEMLGEGYNRISEKQIKDYWTIMVQSQPEDVITILTNLTSGKESFDDFITKTDHDVYDSFKDELYFDDEEY